MIVVDIQNDFLPGGALGVPKGDEVMPVLLDYARRFDENALAVFATRDWHPADHCSFRERGGIWPPHCVAGTTGAERPSTFRLPPRTVTISKGTNPDREAYSGFQGTSLDQQLRDAGVTRLFIGGLATDYCVLHTVTDALALGYEVRLLTDAIRAVNLSPDDGPKACRDVVAQGAIATTLSDIAAR